MSDGHGGPSGVVSCASPDAGGRHHSGEYPCLTLSFARPITSSAPTSARHTLYGAQIEVAAAKGVALMAEIFGRPDRHAVLQAGIRWTFDRDRMDLDLLASRHGGVNGANIRLGFTIRR